MSTLAIVLLAVLGLFLFLVLGGAVASGRRRRALEPRLEASLQEVNRRLAAARAEDRGWERGPLEAAALRAFAELQPGAEVRDHVLVQVLDRPGTDEDKAVFRLHTDQGTFDLVMGRQDGAWRGEGVEPA
jgi:hypothetical protein